jgi:hypothetical protein
MKRHERVLDRLRAKRLDDVRGDEHQLVADVDLATPHVRLELGRRQAAVTVRVRQRRQAGATAEIRLRRADGADVQLVVADDGQPHTDRALGVAERASFAGVAQSLVRDLDRLDEADADPGRLVVVVLASNRVGDQPRRLAGAGSGDARRDEEEEVALCSRLRPDARLDVDRGVGRIGRVLRVGDDAELHLEPVGH